jgi:hypothetical protein
MIPERVLGRRRHVDHVRLQPVDDGDQAVERHLEGVERDVGQIPARQQQVAVEQVPALQRLGGGIGVRGLAPGLEQVGPEQPGGERRDRDDRGRPPGAGPPTGRPRPLFTHRGGHCQLSLPALMDD